MEVHRQTCQKCGSRKLRNIIARMEGENDKVFVQCTNCKALVARYVIAQRGYYHHGKGFESYLKGLNRGGYFESSKDFQNDFWELQENAVKQFETVLEELKKLGKDEIEET